MSGSHSFDLKNVSDYELGYLLGAYKGDGSATSGNHPMFRINGGLDREMNDIIRPAIPRKQEVA